MASRTPDNIEADYREFMRQICQGRNYALTRGSIDNRPVYFVDINNSTIASQLDIPWTTDVTGSSEGDKFTYPTSFPDAVISLNNDASKLQEKKENHAGCS